MKKSARRADTMPEGWQRWLDWHRHKIQPPPNRRLAQRGRFAGVSCGDMSTDPWMADATGTLHLPPSLLPHPGPGRRYRVAAEGGQVVVNEAGPPPSEPEAATPG